MCGISSGKFRIRVHFRIRVQRSRIQVLYPNSGTLKWYPYCASRIAHFCKITMIRNAWMAEFCITFVMTRFNRQIATRSMRRGAPVALDETPNTRLELDWGSLNYSN